MRWMIGVLVALVMGGCNVFADTEIKGEGVPVERQQALGERVTRVLAGTPATLHLVAGEQRGILIKGQANLLPYLELTERGSKLEIEVKEGYRLEPPEPIDITITLPKVEELALAGLARGDLSGFSGDELVLSVAGLGDIVASQLALDRLEGNIAGAGSLDLGEGSAREVELNIAGAGGVSGAQFKGEEVEVNIAGSGDVAVNASELLKVGIAGSGSVSYLGNPRLESEIAGSGAISRVGS